MLFCGILVLGAAAQEPQAPVDYVIHPLPGPQGVRLVVAMTFTGKDTGRTRIILPKDRYGTPRLWDAVTDIVVPEGASVDPGPEPWLRMVKHASGGRVTLRYTLEFDPESRSGSAYRPSVGADHFHYLGPQWMARVEGEEDLLRRFRFSFRDVPPGWTVFGSFGIGPGPHTLRSSWEELVPTVLGGGTYQRDPFTLRNRPVVTFIKGDFKAGSGLLFDSVRRIVTHQRRFFGDYGHELLIVTLTARPHLSAGTSIVNAMVCYSDPDNPATRIQRLLAHEMFHQWLPRQGQVDPGDWDDRYDWMNEGFTVYFARRLLLEQELIDERDYVLLFNGDLEELARSPHREMTNEDLRRVRSRGEFTNRHYRLSYLRGALIALNWNAAIRRKSGGSASLADFMRVFMKEARQAGGKLSEERFHELLARYGVESRKDVERWIEQAGPIVPAGDVFGEGWRREHLEVPDPGFRRTKSLRRGVLVGVDEEGPAHAAGLRSGMPLVSLGEAGEEQGLIAVTVKVDGAARRCTYRPRSRVETWQFRPR